MSKKKQKPNIKAKYNPSSSFTPGYEVTIPKTGIYYAFNGTHEFKRGDTLTKLDNGTILVNGEPYGENTTKVFLQEERINDKDS